MRLGGKRKKKSYWKRRISRKVFRFLVKVGERGSELGGGGEESERGCRERGGGSRDFGFEDGTRMGRSCCLGCFIYRDSRFRVRRGFGKVGGC